MADPEVRHAYLGKST
ncbi:MAG: hypothetical protein ACLP62_09440 [Acidimicrobiales bacterium]